MKALKTYLLFIFFLSFLNLNGQELPPITSYTPKDYGAENQNWAISQSKEKYIYVANNKGLLEFNGANWQLYPTPNETVMRSVKAVEDKIFTGFYMDFGYWSKNNFGKLAYTSITKTKKIPVLEDEQFWNIIELDGWVLFQSLERIYLYNLETEIFKIIKPNSAITKMVKVDETIYFQQIGKGIFKIEKGESTLVSEDIAFKNNRLVNIFKEKEGLLFLMQKNGFFFLKNKKVTAWNIEASNNLLNKTIYSSVQLPNKDFILGTISNGLIYLSKKGKINYQINQKKGLTNNTILSVFEDVDTNVWLGLDNGINIINTKSPFKVYRNKEGGLGTVYTSFIDANNLYLGTNQGLFFKDLHKDNGFTFIKNTQGQVWCLVKIGEDLFCGHDSGTFLIKEGRAIKQIDVPGTWDMKPISKKILIQGNYNGLNIIEKVNNQWRFRNKVEGFNNSSRYFEFFDKDQIFVNHEYKGIFKLTIDASYRKVLHIEKDVSVNKGANSSLLKYQNNLLYASKKGVYKYSKEFKKFLKDSVFSLLYTEGEYTSGKLSFNKKNNSVWSFSSKRLNYITPGKLSTTPNFNKVYLSEDIRKGASGYENITQIDKQKYILGISDGYIVIDTDKLDKSEEFQIKINSIKNSTLSGLQKNIDLTAFRIFKNNENTIDFSYNTPLFKKFLNIEFQYQLIGHRNKWSNWSNNSKVLFKNLSFGEYTFKVRSRIGDTISSNVASYSFTIQKPWYLSTVMIVLYILSVILFSAVMHAIYKRYYRKQRERLLEKNQREFELKALENEQQLMRLKNEQLKMDVDSKNRELAASTMSIIKKNEFLNTIKQELKNKGDHQIHRVIKIIDKDLNNTDDWKLFKEAFNNADKDFIKKIKSKHALLTPNDLRLCAYLRLNLSSKEIAPLLNISPKSVEVKRYRLRKKINLPHESNLIDYILDI
ncbi:MAG: triple tyrosine motif-containing protein [Polaribacter sp.]|nr:triple tyrosine motif-containing protein [Polaribacter sp.]